MIIEPQATRLPPPPLRMLMKYPGSKGALRHGVVAQLPPHKLYCEPFGGSAAVFLAKEPSAVEYYNDTEGVLVDLFRIIRDGNADFIRLCRLVELTPYARSELNRARDEAEAECRVTRVHNFLVRSWFSLGGAVYDFKTGFNASTTDRKIITAWNSVPDRLRSAVLRFKNVYIEQRSGPELMLTLDAPDSCFYVDPPYLESTLNFRKKCVYRDSFCEADHIDMLNVVNNLNGRVLISGYRSDLYDRSLVGWRRIDSRHIVRSGRAATECLWCNFR